MKQRRKVRIQLIRDTWFVLYVGRRKHQHYSAAQFYAKDHTEGNVIKWVQAQPNLELDSPV